MKQVMTSEYRAICRITVEGWKKCPFCGHSVKLVDVSDDYNPLFDVECNTPDCYLSGGADWMLSLEDLDRKWNKRVVLETECERAVLESECCHGDQCCKVA